MNDFEELGRRALASKHWRWMAGMALYGSGCRVHDTHGSWVSLSDQDEDGDYMSFLVGNETAIPDLDDPATLGCLRQVVIDAWGVETVDVWYNSDSGPPEGPPLVSRWGVGGFNHFKWCKAEGEFGHGYDDFRLLWALGLLAALEAAP